MLFLKKLDQKAKGRVEVLLAHGAKYLGVSTNPFGHLAIRIDDRQQEHLKVEVVKYQQVAEAKTNYTRTHKPWLHFKKEAHEKLRPLFAELERNVGHHIGLVEDQDDLSYSNLPFEQTYRLPKLPQTSFRDCMLPYLLGIMAPAFD